MPTSGYLQTPWGPMEWRAPDDPPPRPPSPHPPPKELTVEEQAFEDVKAYFAWLGKPVPPEEIAWCQEAIRQEAEALARPPPVFETPPPRPVIDERPDYGTPEFWAWCRRTKKDREAKKAAEEAEKEKKRKEKEDAAKAKEAEKLAAQKAKEAAKAAKEAEKLAAQQAKEAAKAAKEAAKALKATKGKK